MSMENANENVPQQNEDDTQVAMYQQLNTPQPEPDEPEVNFLLNPSKSFWDCSDSLEFKV